MTFKVVYIVFAMMFYSSVSFADTEEDIRQLMESNFELSHAEDVSGVLGTIHTDSPIYASMANLLKQINERYDLDYKLLSFQLIGQDEKYVYAKMKFLTKKISGGEFRDNELSALAAFKQENGKWKIWNQMNLDIEFK